MKTSQTHLPSLLSSILFAVSAVLILGVGLLMGSAAFFAVVRGREAQTQQTILFATLTFEGILLLLATFFSLQKTLQKPAADRPAFLKLSPWLTVIMIVITGLTILAGNWIGSLKTVSWLILPLLTIPAVVLPLGMLLGLGTHNLPLTTRWQAWSILGLGMTLIPFLLLIVEAVLGILVFFGGVLYIMTQPGLADKLQTLAQQMMILGPQSEEAQQLLLPLLTKPGVIITALVYTAFLVPAIEEALKPLGVWLLANRLDSAAQGFALGALSGASYALVETIGVSGQGNDWAILLLTRIGTGLLHITTSALMGSAIVFAFRQRRYLRLLGTYLLAVAFHGIWNTSALLFSFSSLARMLNQAGFLSTLQPIAIAVLSALSLLLLATLLFSNDRMKRLLASPASEPAPHPENQDSPLP